VLKFPVSALIPFSPPQGIAQIMTFLFSFLDDNSEADALTQILQAVFNVPTANIAVLDDRGVIVAVNESWRRYGRQNGLQDPQDGIGTNYLEVCKHSGTASGLATALGLQAILDKTAERFEREYLLYATPEQEYWFQMKAVGTYYADRQYVVVAHEDISERKAAERVLAAAERDALLAAVRAEQDESVQAVKSHMLERISHEFRGPLALIKTLVYMAEQAPEEQPESFDAIRGEVERLARMLDDAATTLRDPQGQLVLRPRPTLIQRLLEDGVARQVLLTKRTIETYYTLPVPVVLVDGHLVELILDNLLGNALKYSGAGAGVRLDAWQADGHLWFRVLDHGMGIPAADQAHVFEALYRGSNTTGQAGRGLGLKLVQDAVRACEGRIQFASEAGQTVFTVQLPAPGV
jgi:signal transduction histidine kinase